ncbi:hypothetical protein GCM10027429_34330 [Marivirga atlantica]|jgi:hypothetical protein
MPEIDKRKKIVISRALFICISYLLLNAFKLKKLIDSLFSFSKPPDQYILSELKSVNIIYLLSLIFTLNAGYLCAQKVKKTPVQDTVSVAEGYVLILKDTFYTPENDTLIIIEAGKTYNIRKSPYFKSDRFYDSLKSKASRTQLTRKLFSLLFKSSSSEITNKKPVTDAESFYEPYKGKTYGEIRIKRVPILEGSVRDTTKTANSWYAKTMNKIHVNTRKKIIEENIFIRSGKQVDPYELADNERILRQFRTIRDAKIYLSPSKDNPEIVDVTVVVQDVVSIGANLDYTNPSDFSVDLYQRNMLGYARDLQLSYFFNEFEKPEMKHGYGVGYRVPNFWGSFIQGDFLYENNSMRELLSANLKRDFFTPEIKYGGGIILSQLTAQYSPLDSPKADYDFSRNEATIWIGRSFQLLKRTNLITQARVSKIDFIRRPYISEKENRYFTNADTYFLSMGLINRTYAKSKLIRGFGRTEDITKGSFISATYAYQQNEFYNRNYWELDVGFANYFKNVGYMSFTSALGVFDNVMDNKWEDGAFRNSYRYFSPLLFSSKYSFRQFFDVEYTKGINKLSENFLTVASQYDNGEEIRPLGDKKLNIAFESVLFTPWYFYGCKFSLYNRNTFNWLSYDELLSKRNYYASASIGLRVLNESLVFPTIDFSFTFYNSPIGFTDSYQFRISNNYNSSFRDLSISRPEIIRF